MKDRRSSGAIAAPSISLSWLRPCVVDIALETRKRLESWFKEFKKGLFQLPATQKKPEQLYFDFVRVIQRPRLRLAA